MDLIDRLKQIGDRVEKMKAQVETEEATKNAFIMPFIQALGYDVFNPMEVIPEFTADIGTKKGEKVDYCICIEEKPTIIIECKSWQHKLDVHQSQLFRYFHVVEARFAILTNGISYRFYADLEEKNKMDGKPFFEFSITKITENNINALKRFQKSNFDIDSIIDSASDLKYSKEIKDILAQELNSPSDDFVKLIAKQVYSGKVTSKVLEQFKVLTQKSSSLLIKEIINDRLSKVIDNDIEEELTANHEDETELETLEDDNNGIITTEEELQGYRVIQAILLPIVASERIFYRDTKSYFSILIDDNNRKCVCRLWLNRSKKYLEVFDSDKKGGKILIEKIEDVYNYKDRIIASASKFIEEQTI